jgi:hypothetical protein
MLSIYPATFHCYLVPKKTCFSFQSFSFQVHIPFFTYIYTYLFFFLSFFYYHLYIFLHVYTLLGPSPSFPCPNTSRKTLFHSLLWFCWRKNMGVNKKDIAFLLVWDKDSYTERFLAQAHIPCSKGCFMVFNTWGCCILIRLPPFTLPYPSSLPTIFFV